MWQKAEIVYTPLLYHAPGDYSDSLSDISIRSLLCKREREGGERERERERKREREGERGRERDRERQREREILLQYHLKVLWV